MLNAHFNHPCTNVKKLNL